MLSYEQLGLFYLGRFASGEDFLYPSRELCTHGLCVGMTGSGKTGFCLSLLEEAAIDGVPAIVVDPKGDLANLCLSFPELSAEQLLPWVSEDEARQKGLSLEAYAAAEAKRWTEGLAAWRQTPERSRLIREGCELNVYTPGANYAEPLSLAGLFRRPAAETLADTEALADLLAGTAAGLLGLLGQEAKAQSREQVLLENILQSSWQAGRDLDLEGLVRAIKEPPFRTVGLLGLEDFYPEKDRFQLMLAFNNLLASPSFAAWFQGADLDIESLLYNPAGKGRIAIISLAHLGDSERMFFVSILLNRLLAWLRRQRGTSSLRALFYMDEIYGYFPPVAEPPSKKPLLTLLKQARAYGLGLLLATQNPVDLDYKGLANIGSWFIGRLQTERDRARLLDGLEALEGGVQLPRVELERALSALEPRQWLYRSAKSSSLERFESRFALSYLRGPLTRQDLRLLSELGLYERAGRSSAETKSQATRAEFGGQEAEAAAGSPLLVAAEPEAEKLTPPADHQLPLVASGIRQRFARGARGKLEPAVLAFVSTSFHNKEDGESLLLEEQLLIPLNDGLRPLDLEATERCEWREQDLSEEPEAGSRFAALPDEARLAKSWSLWEKDIADWLYRNSRLTLASQKRLKLRQGLNESETAFRRRVDLALREERDAALEKIKAQYRPKRDRLQEKIRLAEQRVDREEEQAADAKRQSMISIGSTVLGAIFGKSLISGTSIGRAATAGRAISRSGRQKKDISRAEDSLQKLQEDLQILESECEKALDFVAEQYAEAELSEQVLQPLKRDCQVKLSLLIWHDSAQSRK